MSAGIRTTLLGIALLAASSITQAAEVETIAITPELVAAANKEGELTLQYSSPLLTMQGYAAEFNKAYPGIKLNLERKAGSTGAQSLLQESAAGLTRIDLFEGSDQGANADLIGKNLFAPVRPANVNDFEPAALESAPYLYFSDSIQTVIAYNPKFITDEQAQKLKSWTGVLDPEFKGKISLTEPTFGVTLSPLLYIMSTQGLGEDFLRKVKEQQPRLFLTTPQARDAITSGQSPISWGAQWDAVTLSDITRGKPVRFVYPDPAPRWGTGGWGVLAKAPHPNAARLFFAWKFSKDGARAAQEATSNTRSYLKDFPDTREAARLVVKESWYEAPRNVWTPNRNDWVSKGPQYQELWQKIMKQRGG